MSAESTLPTGPTNPPRLRKNLSIVSWTLQLVAAGILLQTLYFKFTGADVSIYIFEQVGMEPWGRIGSGVAELVAGVLLLVPTTVPIGALLALAVMAGAIASHLTVLGIVVQNDGGELFALAVVVFLASAAILAIRRNQLMELLRTVGVIRQ